MYVSGRAKGNLEAGRGAVIAEGGDGKWFPAQLLPAFTPHAASIPLNVG